MLPPTLSVLIPWEGGLFDLQLCVAKSKTWALTPFSFYEMRCMLPHLSH